jgi:hypothetical protein
MDKKISRILKKNNNSNYILKGLIKKKYIQKGGSTTVDLRNTQENLLKALKSFSSIDISANPFLGSIDELNTTLVKIKNNFLYTDSSKKVPTDDSPSFTQNLNKFDKFLNDISGGEVKLEYKNDYKMKDLLKVDLKSLNEINTLFDEVSEFKERNTSVGFNPSGLPVPQEVGFERRNTQVVLNPDGTPAPLQNIEFNQRTNTVGLNSDGLPTLQNFSLDQRTSKVSVNESVLKPKIINLNFKERNNKVNLQTLDELIPSKMIEGINLEADSYASKMRSSDEVSRQEILKYEGQITKLKGLVNILKKLNTLIKNNIIYYKSDIISDEKMDEIVTQIKFVEIDMKETEKVDGIDLIPLKATSLIDKDIFLGGKKRDIEDGDLFYSDEFIDSILQERREIKQIGGALMNEYLDKTSEWLILMKDRNIVNEFKNTVNEYNIVYIQSYYYKLFVLKNINKFSRQENEIYQFMNKDTMQKYIKILNTINTYISNPEAQITGVLATKESTIHYYFYFKHYIIIKNLLSFFNKILQKWTNNTYKLSIFDYDGTSPINKEIIKIFLLFNLFFKILDKYNANITKF